MIETVLGALVLMVAVIFIVFAYTHSQLRAVGGYEVLAKFGRVDGLAIGDEVRLGGMKVGSVSNMSLDLDGYVAVVTVRLDSSVRLPTDSAIAIHTDGLFGGKFIEIQPGGDESYIPPNGFFSFHQDSLVLEQVIEKIVAIARDVSKKCKKCTGG
ncbi:MAG: outer membrane lipid asymmetry maintenance protein MlaD [Kiloniellales bacterium]